MRKRPVSQHRGWEGAGPTQTKVPKPNKAGFTGGMCVFGESPGKTGGGQCAAQANGQGRTQGSGGRASGVHGPWGGGSGGGEVSARSSHSAGPPGPEQRSPAQGGALCWTHEPISATDRRHRAALHVSCSHVCIRLKS